MIMAMQVANHEPINANRVFNVKKIDSSVIEPKISKVVSKEQSELDFQQVLAQANGQPESQPYN